MIAIPKASKKYLGNLPKNDNAINTKPTATTMKL